MQLKWVKRRVKDGLYNRNILSILFNLSRIKSRSFKLVKLVKTTCCGLVLAYYQPHCTTSNMLPYCHQGNGSSQPELPESSGLVSKGLLFCRKEKAGSVFYPHENILRQDELWSKIFLFRNMNRKRMNKTKLSTRENVNFSRWKWDKSYTQVEKLRCRELQNRESMTLSFTNQVLLDFSMILYRQLYG